MENYYFKSLFQVRTNSTKCSSKEWHEGTHFAMKL